MYFLKKKNITIKSLDSKKLFLKLKLKLKLKLDNDFVIEISSIYGDEISAYLYQKKVNLNSLIKNKYDDIWLFQLLAIDERNNLLKYGDNIILKLKKLINENYRFKNIINNFVKNGDTQKLESFFKSLSVDKKLIPNGQQKDKYLMDALYFIIANNDDI